ncbi:MAG: 3-oxoacyl-[acyl-carrier-protein] synthase III C-terminal domain-containing protein [Leptolyngbyaceae cyanobacterium MO_188.B28]|nr:3-oxoacyl-[acyl-carrier-protein] synthase III C-terminal domain-containing protein [Leptolyngbyaceae cyanobacterium MO_188.B28]
MVRYINDIFTASLGEEWSNEDLLPHYQTALEALPLAPKHLEKLMDATKFFLMGKRKRNTSPNWINLSSFDERASAFERSAEQVLERFAEQIHAVADKHHKNVVFDAIITTTSTGNLMPGLSYRLAAKLNQRVRADTLLFDLGNVGCTGSLKALKLANGLDSTFEHILVISVEAPTTLINLKAKTVDIWQGNCTFGDGAAAMWLSSEASAERSRLQIDKIAYRQYAEEGLNLIRWGYSNYYTFSLENEETFNQSVQKHVLDALSATQSEWCDSDYWAIHPAGITLLLRLSRKLGISRSALKPTTNHFETFSNMSSASIIHILKQLSEDIPSGERCNLLTMGAGFNVIYGRVIKE